MNRPLREDPSAAVAAGQWHVAVVSAITGGVLGLASAMLLGAAFGFRPGDAAPDLTTVPAWRAGLVRWGALTDMLGFQLLPVPLMLHLGHRFDAGRDALMGVATAAGLLYAAVGSIGAVIVAAVVPPLLTATTPHAAIELELVRRLVFIGLWQTLGTIPWGVWMLATGVRQHRSSPWLGGAAVAVGVAALAAAAARLLDAEPLVTLPLTLAIALFPLWLSAVGIHLARVAGTGAP